MNHKPDCDGVSSKCLQFLILETKSDVPTITIFKAERQNKTNKHTPTHTQKPMGIQHRRECSYDLGW